MKQIIIIGAGAAGLCAALTIAESGKKCVLISASPSERAQSNLAAGGINAAVGGEELFAEDTLSAGEHLANRQAVDRLTGHADETVEWLRRQGVPFQMENGSPALRKLGGHKQGRTFFAGSITGKAIMSALIDQVRKYEAEGLVERRSHHVLEDILIEDGSVCHGCIIQNRYDGSLEKLVGSVILASGGMSGLFPGKGTGVRENNAGAAAIAFSRGVSLGNLEFIQYHPTTISIPGKQCLISEAARSEGGRIYVEKDGKPWYFLEELYGAEGNLISRDRVVKEFWKVRQIPGVAGAMYLDMRNISDQAWENDLSCLRDLCLEYMKLDPKKAAIPIQEGIHYFMGGILTDADHRTNVEKLYAAGECSCIYHGANRLGGNSLLGAVYGGRTAAKTAMEEREEVSEPVLVSADTAPAYVENRSMTRLTGEILVDALTAVRNEENLRKGLNRLEELNRSSGSVQEKQQILLGMAMIHSALARKESRGAHIRTDYPEKKDEFQKVSVVTYRDSKITLSYQTP